jgi:hypothetical protein
MVNFMQMGIGVGIYYNLTDRLGGIMAVLGIQEEEQAQVRKAVLTVVQYYILMLNQGQVLGVLTQR